MDNDEKQSLIQNLKRVSWILELECHKWAASVVKRAIQAIEGEDNEQSSGAR